MLKPGYTLKEYEEWRKAEHNKPEIWPGARAALLKQAAEDHKAMAKVFGWNG